MPYTGTGATCGHEPRDLVRIHDHPGILLRVPDVKNQTSRWDSLDGGQQERHGLFIEIRETHLPRKAAELGSNGLDRLIVDALGHDEHTLR